MSPKPALVERYAAAVPLALTQAYRLGPFARAGTRPPESPQIRAWRSSHEGIVTAIDSMGATARRLLQVLLWHEGELTAATLAFETAGADHDDLADATARLVDAGLATARGGGLILTAELAATGASAGRSLREPHATTTDVVEQICRRIGATPPSRKDARIDAIEAVFANPERRAGVLGRLSAEARALLERIADRAGPEPVAVDDVGITTYGLHEAAAPRYAFQRRPARAEVAPLAELVALGIVGLDAYDRRVWIWREAWPLLERPLHRDWPAVRPPATGAARGGPPTLPSVVGLVERALAHWETAPPPVLKGGDLRLGKPVLRSTAKALGSVEGALDVVASAALSLGLLGREVVAVSGRGRQRRVEEAWVVDGDARAAWLAAPPLARWARLVAEWANPPDGERSQRVANRHLVLWELSSLPPGIGWLDEAAAARWFEHRYEPIGAAEGVAEALRDLRHLGLVPPDGPAALAELGRLVLDDPVAVSKLELGSATAAIVQADHTVVCPPDLHPDLVERLRQLAHLESDAGSAVYRLDEARITAAIQRDSSSEEVIEFLETLSSVPLADTVRRLVDDAAARVDRVRVVAASTVVIFSDPADLLTATRVAAAKLEPMSPTVAVSELDAGRVRDALARKGLAPRHVAAAQPELRRRSSGGALDLERSAARYRSLAQRSGRRTHEEEAVRLEAAAAVARDPSLRLALAGPIAATPALLATATA